MLSAQELKEFAKTLSVPAVGICSAEPDRALLRLLKKRREAFSPSDFEEEDLERRMNPKGLMPEAKSVLVCLFPYYVSHLPAGNLSRYAMVPDYHQVAAYILSQLAAFVKDRVPAANCLPVCDTSPLVDRWLAYQAGLGFYGKNSMLIHPIYGSYFFIGSLLLDISLETDAPMANVCDGCDACIRACPGGALSQDFGFDCERCISYLTQKKTVTKQQAQLLAGQESVYGCDVCQQVCPHNQNLPDTPIQAFCRDCVTYLDEKELTSLSARAFRRQYADYPFSWCSKQTILKNFKRT